MMQLINEGGASKSKDEVLKTFTVGAVAKLVVQTPVGIRQIAGLRRKIDTEAKDLEVD